MSANIRGHSADVRDVRDCCEQLSADVIAGMRTTGATCSNQSPTIFLNPRVLGPSHSFNRPMGHAKIDARVDKVLSCYKLQELCQVETEPPGSPISGD